MLKGIDPLLTPDLVYALATMGHGDEIAVVDLNFPARSTAGDAPVIELAGVSAPKAVGAILSLMPLDDFVDVPCFRMAVVDDPERVEPVQHEATREIERVVGNDVTIGSLERFAFYERASRCFAVVRTGERRFYGCFLLKKGVVAPEDG